jgi:ankyrin repeat protein
VELLIAKGADLGATETSGYTPLSRATFKNHEEMMQLLKQAGAECQSPQIMGDHFRQQCLDVEG